MIVKPKKLRFTVGEYFKMGDAGIFDDQRVAQYRKPANPNGWAYESVKHYGANQEIKPLGLPKIAIAASELVP